jgi:hypothetical protein
MTATNVHSYAWKYLKTLTVNKAVKTDYATTAIWNGEIAGVYHHGNQIALLTKDAITITHHGWDSNTTSARLDQILTANYGNEIYRVCKSKGKISLAVKGSTPVAFDRITLQRTGVK